MLAQQERQGRCRFKRRSNLAIAVGLDSQQPPQQVELDLPGCWDWRMHAGRKALGMGGLFSSTADRCCRHASAVDNSARSQKEQAPQTGQAWLFHRYLHCLGLDFDVDALAAGKSCICINSAPEWGLVAARHYTVGASRALAAVCRLVARKLAWMTKDVSHKLVCT